MKSRRQRDCASRRIDDEDMKALIAALEDLGYSGDVEPSTHMWTGQPTEWWALMLRWVGDHLGDVAAVGGFLVVLGEKVRAIFRSRRKPPPKEIWLYGSDGLTVIARVEVPEEDGKE